MYVCVCVRVVRVVRACVCAWKRFHTGRMHKKKKWEENVLELFFILFLRNWLAIGNWYIVQFQRKSKKYWDEKHIRDEARPCFGREEVLLLLYYEY
jgi:hypothetical protein